MSTGHHQVDPSRPVVLDIGGDIGAAIVTAPMALAGREVEIRSAGASWDGRHVAFHVRERNGCRLNAAVFPQLTEGGWEVRLRHVETSPVVSLCVLGGRITTVPYRE
jgi:hypothetical protein